MQATEVDIAPIHDIVRPRLDGQLIEPVHIVHFPVRNVHKTRNAAAQIEQRRQLDGSFASAKPGPGTQAQTQVDRGRIERIDRLFEIDSQPFAGVQTTRATNQHLREVGVDAPVVRSVRIGQGAASNLAAKAGVIQLRFERAQAGFDVAQALAISELSESQ